MFFTNKEQRVQACSKFMKAKNKETLMFCRFPHSLTNAEDGT